MDINALIPVSFAIPQDFSVFRMLELITFFFHFFFVNYLLGSSLIVLILNVSGKVMDKPVYPETKQFLTGRLPVIFAYTVNLGVAPYLFLQVIYGSYIYTSSILIGFYWLSVIFTIIAAYSLIYYYRSKEERFSKGAKIAFAAVFSLLIIYTALIFTGNVNLMLEPDKWSVFFKNQNGTFFDFKNPMLYAKLFHTITGSIAVAGLFTAIHCYFKKDKDEKLYNETGFGIKVFAVAALVQIISGIILYTVIPSNVVKALPERFTYYLICGGLLTLLSVFLVYKRKFMIGKVVFSLTFFLMIIMKDLVRASYLQMFFNSSSLKVVKQNGPFLIFISVFVVCTVFVIFLFRRVLKDKVDIISEKK